jgi:hypothetical protein
MPSTSTTKFSPLLNKELTQEPIAYKGKVPRGEEACNKNTGFDCKDQYADCEQYFGHDGSFSLTTWGPDPKKQAHHERFLANGTGEVNYGDGSCSRHVTGTNNFVGKNGGQESYNSNKDSAAYGGSRQNIGTDKQAGGKHLARGPGGGYSRHTFGYMDSYAAMRTDAYSAGSSTSHNIHKHAVNAEGGIGFGVNQDSNMRLFMRMEPDGTYHLQVTPKGQEGGNAVVKITPDGAILITSESTITVTSKGTHTIKAPLVKIDAPIETTSTIKSAGNHTAPKFIGCATKAKSKC